MKMKRGFIGCLLSIFVILTMFSGCNVGSTDGGEADTVLGGGSSVLRIVSGSENSELEPILEEFSDREHVRIEMTYMGSLDIMRLLGEEDIPYAQAENPSRRGQAFCPDKEWPDQACQGL